MDIKIFNICSYDMMAVLLMTIPSSLRRGLGRGPTQSSYHNPTSRSTSRAAGIAFGDARP
jgi:hypothetical protein